MKQKWIQNLLSQLKWKTANLKKDLKNLDKERVLTVVTAVFLVVAHILVLLFISQSWRYYSIQPTLFGSAVAIILCLLAIIDIVFFVGFNHQDLALKIVSVVMAVLLLIGGSVGTYYINRVNSSVNSILDDGKSEKYEMFSGALVFYNQNNKFKSISDLAGKRVGMLEETSNGISYLAKQELDKAKIDYATIDYKTNTELMTALIDNKVDAIAISSAYKTIYGNDENSAFLDFLDDLEDLTTFEQEMKVETNRSTKNIAKEPFNVLLIGYSRTDIGSPIGLADSIILATINPQTYTVSMMSIARDSFVPISCYGGEYDKINSGRSTSRACFVETVKDFIGMDIDYYMELDYLGLVAIVNAIGGIYINNPVAFELDGIYVPAGDHVFADGQMALQFSRERHHMPGGDFDRQQHQKEVIIEIAKKFIKSGDINLALNAMDEASDWMSTDMTLSQLTSMFNLLLNSKNYTGLDTFSLVDFHNSRITGNGGLLYYSMQMRLPLWVYLVYQGSYDESIQHVKDVMGNYSKIDQDKSFEFSANNPYIRGSFTSEDYPNKYLFTPDPMPAYWASLSGLTAAEAQAWAAANGVKLSVNVINFGEEGYDESREGRVSRQSVRYGALVSEYPSGSITVMGVKELDPSKMVPNFIGYSYKDARDWARSYGVPYDIDFDTSVSGEVGKVVSQSVSPYTLIENVNNTIVFTVKAGQYTIKFNTNGHGSAPKNIVMTTGDADVELPWLSNVTDGGTTYKFLGWYTEKDGGRQISSSGEIGESTLYAHWEDVNHVHKWKEVSKTNPTCDKEGVINYVCEYNNNHKKSEPIDALGHDWQVKEAATCEKEGSRKCKRCNKTETIPATGEHTWGDWIIDQDADVGVEGSKHRKCSVCNKEESQPIPAIEACTDEAATNYGQAAPCVYPDPDPQPDPDPGDDDGGSGGEGQGG